MFGYVVANKPEMKIKDYDRYREYYCGVCHALKKRHGQCSRISLSYDSTFAAVLLTALYEPGNIRMQTTCMMHPLKKHIYLQNPYIDYVADMNLVLAYYKCIDDFVDDKNYVKLGYGNIIKSKVKNIKNKYPKKVAVIREGIRALSYLELKKCDNLDELSATFGNIMGEILSVAPKDVIDNISVNEYEENWVPILRRLGFNLGKFIYILDAFDDIEKDIKDGNFNPFKSRFQKEQTLRDNANELSISIDYEYLEDWVKKILMLIAAEMADDYERLPIVGEVAILRNIVYSGVWTKFFCICERRKNDERSL